MTVKKVNWKTEQEKTDFPFFLPPGISLGICEQEEMDNDELIASHAAIWSPFTDLNGCC